MQTEHQYSAYTRQPDGRSVYLGPVLAEGVLEAERVAAEQFAEELNAADSVVCHLILYDIRESLSRNPTTECFEEY